MRIGAWVILLPVASMALSLSCDRPWQPPEAIGLAGCYAFSRRDGNETPLGEEMPDTLLLRTDTLRAPNGLPSPDSSLAVTVVARHPREGLDSMRLDSLTVSPWPPAWQQYYSRTSWRLIGPDSLSILLHANMSLSWSIALRVTGDSLTGVAERYSDVLSGHPKVPVVAHRATCPTVGAP